MPNTQTAHNQGSWTHNPISFCSPCHKTTDTATETDLSNTQISVLLLFLRGQEYSLVFLSACMSIGTFQGYSYVLCDQYVWLFQPKNIRAFLLLSVWSGVKLLAVNWASLRHTPTPHPHILTCNNLRARPGLETVWLSLSSNRTNNEKY